MSPMPDPCHCASVTQPGITPLPNPSHGPRRCPTGQAREADLPVLPEPGGWVGLLAGIACLAALRRRSAALLAGLGVCAALTLAGSVDAAVFNVPAASPGQLIEILSLANNEALSPGPDTVVLAAGSTYTLNGVNNTNGGLNALPAITSSITIEGNGSTIQMNPLVFFFPPIRLFIVLGGDLALNDLTLANGGAERGGAILQSFGTLSLSRCTLRNNRASSAGGAVASQNASVTLDDCVVAENTAGSSGGGLVADRGSLTVTRSVIRDNESGRDGGGISVADAALSISGNSTVRDNRARLGGGVASFSDTLTLTDSRISGNSATERGGGLLLTKVDAFLERVSVVGNHAEAGGGGVNSSLNSSVTLNDCVVAENTAGSSGGGLLADDGGSLTVTRSVIRDNESGDDGGGISEQDGSLRVLESTVSGNRAGGGGGISSIRATALITNSTLSGNIGVLFGGGLLLQESDAELSSATITNNAASLGGGIDVASSAVLQLRNTLIADNSAVNSPDCFSNGSTASRGFNLIGDGDDCPLLLAGPSTDQIGTGASPIDPGLGPLQDNGGPTQTHELLPASPAIDAANPSGCFDPDGTLLVTDQRGAARAFDGDGVPICDVGAFEFGAAPPEPEPEVCDVDGNGEVNRFDIEAIFEARGEPASGADDPRDINGDGLITVNDGRLCTFECANPECEPSPAPACGLLGIEPLALLALRRRRNRKETR